MEDKDFQEQKIKILQNKIKSLKLEVNKLEEKNEELKLEIWLFKTVTFNIILCGMILYFLI